MSSSGQTKDIVFVISAGGSDGLGHLMRCAVLAREARRQDMSAAFVLEGDDSVRAILSAEVADVEVWDWNDENIASSRARLVVFDTKRDIEKECSLVAKTDSRLVLLDRLSPATGAVDLYVLPGLDPCVPASLSRRAVAGPDYVVISEVFVVGKDRAHSLERDTLLISLGGSDPLNVTCVVMDACHRLKSVIGDKILAVVIGPSNENAGHIEEKASAYGMEAVRSPSQRAYCDYLSRAFLAITGFGISAYEIAYLGIPSLYVTHFEEDMDEAMKLESEGLGWLLGYGPELSASAVESKCLPILARPGLAGGITTVPFDGQGASRIVDEFARLISS